MDGELPFRMSLGVLLLAVAAIRFAYIGWATVGIPKAGRKHPAAGMGRVPYLLLLLVGWLWVIAPLAYVLAPNWLAWAALPLPGIARWAGVGLGVVGVVLLGWVHRTLGSNWNAPGVVQDGQTLVRDGPYRWVRHPMYTTFAAIALAYSLVSANLLVAAIGLGYWVAVAATAGAEEAALLVRFGESYRAYMQRTGRFLPRWSPPAAVPGGERHAG